MFLIVNAPVNRVLALSQSTLDIFGSNNIVFYDPSERGSCYSGGASLSGDTVMAKIVNYANGNNPYGIVMPAAGIAGLLAGLQGESGFNPFRWYGDKYDTAKAYGLAQFYPSSKIAGPLSTDPRTASFFDEYFPTVEYTHFDQSTGYPKSPVPQEIIDAWLAVQLDFMFGPSGEYQNTTVGTYRNWGGRMGLDYIPNSYTLGQAMESALTPEDATRIWVWIYERPGDKETDSNTRSKNAQGWLDFVNNIVSSPATVKTDAVTFDSNAGSKVTIIGDSLIANSQSAIQGMLPQAQIDAQSGRSFDDGIAVLQGLADSGELRDVVVFALGTDSSVKAKQAQNVVDIVGSSKKVIFITNYSMSDDYKSNNNAFMKVKDDNSNVLIADWNGSVTSSSSVLVNADGVTPNEDGQKTLAMLIANSAGVSGPAAGTCNVGAIQGGLTDEQAQALADYYNSPEVTLSDWNFAAVGNTKRNCVAFSFFFVQRFTSIGPSSYSIFLPGGDGGDVAHSLAVNKSLLAGNEPRPFAVFSTRVNKGIYGHTGIVVNVNGDTITTVEAAWSDNGPGQLGHIVRRKLSDGYFRNVDFGQTFTYLDSIINLSELYSIVGGSN